jgi:predicted metal-dependent hydrolase
MTELEKAVKEFNNGAYYACHETLEKLWLKEKSFQRDIYKGILQIAVALFHMKQGNISGTKRLLRSGVSLIKPFGPQWSGLDLDQLGNDSLKLLQALEGLTDDNIYNLEIPIIHRHEDHV